MYGAPLSRQERTLQFRVPTPNKVSANPENRETKQDDEFLYPKPKKQKKHEQEKIVVTSNLLTTARLPTLLINKIKLR